MAKNAIVTGPNKAKQWDCYKSLLVQNKRDLEDSWQRCKAAGLEPGDRPEPVRFNPAQLESPRADDSARVRALGLTELRTLYKHLGKRGFTLTFANADSVILDRIPGTNIVVGQVDGDDLAPGNCWYETVRGTNAVGTAANTERAAVVLGGDHYLRAYHDLVCIAKPVFSANGAVAAILDATIHNRKGQMSPSELAYVLGLLHMSADHIETELFKQQHRHSLVLHTNAVADGVGNGNAAFAFDQTGRLEGASRAAMGSLEALGLQIGCHFEQIFRLDFADVYRRVQAPVDFMQVEDRLGRCYYATIYASTPREPSPPATQTTARQDPDRAVKPAVAGGGLLGWDPAVREIVATVERAKAFGAPVLIRGETGTGKELLARHVHRVSGRTGAFVDVNCAAVPESLIEAELFGYEQGAFTGARKGGALGLVRQADGGTLFLDEIGDMPCELQGRLLRLLDRWRVRPVGSEQEYAVDVQLVSATNRNLEEAVEHHEFRLDLFHRINVVDVRLPALRERRDFDDIARSLLYAIQPKTQLRDAALAALRSLRWPGNIRELHNALTRLLIRADGGPITNELVGQELAPSQALGGMHDANRECAPVDDDTVKAAFRRCRGNVSATARALGVSRTTVYKHLRRSTKSD